MYSINRRPLLGGASDSEFEDDLETEVDDPSVSVPDEKPFLKSYEPHDKYVPVICIVKNLLIESAWNL